MVTGLIERIARMSFQSILFHKADERIDGETPDAPDYFIDLNLDQVVDAITAHRQDYNLKPFFYTPLKEHDSIKYRQEVSKDLENGTLLESIKSFSQKMIVMRRYLNLIEKLYYKYHQEGWYLEAILVYCDAVSCLMKDLSQADLQSRGFVAFRDYLSAYTASDEFQTLLSETQKLKTDLSTVKYCVIINNSTVKVRKYNHESDYSLEVEQTFEKFKQGAVKDYRVKLTIASGMNHIEAQILDFVAKLYPEIFSDLDRYCLKNDSFLDETIRVFDREIQFYVAYQDYIQAIKNAGLKFCYPKITHQGKEIYNYEGYDVALAHKRIHENLPIVWNDFFLKDKERIIVVSGPNQGGKTTFARTFGQLHYLACLGLPVPGRRSQLFLFDRLFTHFEKEEDIKNLRGKLQDDLIRIYSILDQATPKSIVIMNEIFTSTTLQDAVFLSEKILERIIELDLLCVCVTFIDELASLSEKTISMVSTVVPENPAVRTYKIIRKPADGLAYAISIAEKYHLTYDNLLERIPS